MRINHLRIKNFRQFQDITLDLSTSNKNYIVGDNGNGKSTLYAAIFFVLTGDLVGLKNYLPNFAKTVNPHDFFNRLSEEYRSEIIIEFSTKSKDGKDINYEIQRHVTLDYDYNYNTENLVTKSIIKKTEYPYEASEIAHQEEINNLIPQDIFPILFFDGENWDLSKSSKDITKVIEKMSDIEIFKSKVQTYLNKLSNLENKKIEEAAKKGINSEFLVDKKQELHTKNNELELLEIEQKNIDNNIKKNNALLGEVKNILREYSDAEEILAEQSNIEKEELANASEIKIALSNNLKYIFDANKFSNRFILEDVKHLNKLTGIEISDEDNRGLEARVIDRILKNNECICGRGISEQEKEVLLNLQKRLPPNSLYVLNKTLDSSIKQTSVGNGSDSIGLIIAHRNEIINKIKNQQETDIDAGESARLNQQLGQLNESISTGEENSKHKADEIKECKYRIDELGKQIDKINAQLEGVSSEVSIVELIDILNKRCKENIDNTMDTYKAALIKNVELYNAKYLDLGNRINLNPDTLFPEKGVKSTGETKVTDFIFVLATIKTLNELYGEVKKYHDFGERDFFTVVDGIYSTIDPQNKQRATTALKSFQEESSVIVMMKTDDYTNVYDSIKGTGKIYQFQIAKKNDDFKVVNIEEIHG